MVLFMFVILIETFNHTSARGTKTHQVIPEGSWQVNDLGGIAAVACRQRVCYSGEKSLP
jgi:hypothetical protein